MLAEEKDTLNQELNEQTNEPEGTENEALIEEVFAEAEAEAGADEGSTDAELTAAKAKIAELEGKLEEEENRIYRLQADFENSRRRARLDLEASEKYRAQSLISDLLPAIDNFERALQMEAENEQAKSILQGMEMVYRSLLEAIKKEGAEQIEAVGKEFDPHLHQAVMQVEDENFDSNIVVEEFQKGYKLKDRVIRPSMVKVNQ
ncbi:MULTISPECIES: nucleotide exchange factor GrpE [Cytobacillus]|uniref:nucleotide exchange factor GrpE n=1 Tax=Cytobacillus TaxID=2675230 RepID=UPI00203DE742|nr:MULTISPECIES: nucleotide exchange factor GrpE [Cytobacillus]MCM3242309.1 nucleotide exchange factor GrpE [Cytobacillus oceanisediminis]MCM3394065.1 nucleotide exchange factor GrpE [Cytobacillus oceanisediminis]UQX54372.1 nucleotide exchange factor GrpE [Cytobacillus pseudoceanisediminis]